MHAPWLSSATKQSKRRYPHTFQPNRESSRFGSHRPASWDRYMAHGRASSANAQGLSAPQGAEHPK